ncbi:hypothetical protein QQ008_24295 [Fulvivirgaceae bacterium BMA10]|uniref:Uncharacterized protein n=1 Tax=Splendidivirga corallicola TaxID=3051826 RepID=A0ABT8KUU1_9BACT|nr:hypothetical protein [Fulvivirgaceae bacterium BMA10]
MERDKEKDEIIQQLTEMLNKPGGKQAARFALNTMGAIPIVGGAIAAAGAAWGEKEQQNFNEKITEWATQTHVDLNKVLKVLELELREPTKANLSLLFGEVLNIELPLDYPDNGGLQVATVLHNETVAEFRPYEEKGWITITSNGNMTNMGANNKIGDSIEDLKRPYGFGNGFVITCHKSLYE